MLGGCQVNELTAHPTKQSLLRITSPVRTLRQQTQRSYSCGPS